MNVALFLEIKNEYTEHLVDTISPYIYEGLTILYKEAVRVADQSGDDKKTLIIFQKILKGIDFWNQKRIDDETERIKQMSRTADYLDDLVKAVIKSNIILLAYSNTISNVIGQTFYNSLTTSTLIHRCYTECGKYAHNNPYLFFHDIEPMDYKRNQIIINQNIQLGIARAIRKILPISLILKEYLVNSVNIIQEPAKVELMPTNNKTNDNVNINQISDKNKKNNADTFITNMIKTENNKTEKDKIKTIMNMDKIIENVESIVKSSAKKNPNILDLNIVSTQSNRDIIGNDSVEKIENINFDDEPTNADNTEKSKLSNTSLSKTSITDRIMPNKSKYNDETSERVDPTKITYIEDYGTQLGGKKKSSHRNKK